MKQKVILLHGALGNHNQLNALQYHLKNNYKVFIYTFPGHELNSASKDPFSIKNFASSLNQFVIENQLEGSLIIGYSMGGYVALFLQSQVNLFSRIVTIGTKFSWNKETSVKETAMLNAVSIEEKIPKYAITLKETFGDEYWKVILEKTAELMMALGNSPELNKTVLSKINIPVTICRGACDKMVTKEECELFSSYIKNSNYVEFENTPHPIEKLDLKDIDNVLNQTKV